MSLYPNSQALSHFDTPKVQSRNHRQSYDGENAVGSRNSLSIKRAQQLMQAFILSLILVVGGVTALTVMDTPPTDERASTREPASLSMSVEPKTLRKEIEVLPIHCQGNSYRLSNVSQVRLTGQVCPGLNSRTPLKHSRIKNISTNSDAMVFLLGKANHFTTDLIPVQAGKNSIEIMTEYANGQTESKIIEVQVNSYAPQ